MRACYRLFIISAKEDIVRNSDVTASHSTSNGEYGVAGASLLVPTEIYVGQTASLTKTITERDVQDFARLSLDVNPVHLNKNYARHTRFGRRIAHGFLTAGLVSAVLGTRLPGPGSIYLSQFLQFKAPVYHGDTITARVEVTAIRPERKILTLRTDVYNQNGTLILTGESVILLDRDDVHLIPAPPSS